MSGLLLDASVLIAAVDVQDRNHAAADELLYESRQSLATTDLAAYEVANVAVAAWKRPDVAAHLLAMIEQLKDDGGMIAVSMPMLNEACDLASDHQISVYDASYVVAARSSGRLLVSCDERGLVSKDLALLPSKLIA